MINKQIGVVEGFFGPAWNTEDRLSYASFLSQVGGDFYIYAPKQDSHLRKGWRLDWSEEYIHELSSLKKHFQDHRVAFGVGLSPFGLGTILTSEDKKFLEERMKCLNEIGIDLLGLFFDDMPTNDHLAKTQIETLNLIKKSFHKKIIFCPTYYTPDPILEKVFGKKPEGYLEAVADLPLDVSIAWTGPKVISPEIDSAHLIEVKNLLKRSPYIWENFFANDGPKNCKFLKLRPFTGRNKEAFMETEAFSFNMMNQAQLSKIVFLASAYVLRGEGDPESSFERALKNLCSKEFSSFVLKNKQVFLEKGLDSISEIEKGSFISELSTLSDPAAIEIIDWLEGKYVVGTECLTD